MFNERSLDVTMIRMISTGFVNRRFMLRLSLAIALGATALAGVPGSAQAQGATAAAQGTAATAPKVRRVVTGHDAQGKSRVVSDEMVNPMDLWKTSAAEPQGAKSPGDPSGLLPTTAPPLDPPVGGNRWMLVTFPPSPDPKPTRENRQGFHRTLTLDYAYVLSGDLTLLLDLQVGSPGTELEFAL